MKIQDTSPVSEYQHFLQRFFKEDPWWDYETETILLETGLPISNLSREKVNLLRVIGHRPDIFYKNFLFFLHAVDACNNILNDFDYLPSPNSLQMAAAIIDMSRAFNHKLDESPTFSEEVILAITNCLVNEGYSEAIAPFSHIGITGLTPGQTAEDTSNKLKAIAQYVHSIYNESTN